jgi:peptidoglycan hydrolase-like protein with peptidoglycan-binding domain
MYPLLRKGDKLPSVAVVQILCNRTLADHNLTVDGIYGTKTKAAVKAFQKPRNLGFDGVIGKNTWPRLSTGAYLDVIDAIDITDDSGEKAAIKRAGGTPILVGWQCNGIGQMMLEIANRAHSGGSMFLLRFHGHGSSGNIGISDGFGYVRNADKTKTYLQDQDMTAITNGNVNQAIPALQRLTRLFNSYSSVEMHHCSVAQKSDGRILLQKLANVWQVPVSAGRRTQYGGGRSTFRFEGPVHTAFPAGGSLKSWSQALRALPQMSVP